MDLNAFIEEKLDADFEKATWVIESAKDLDKEDQLKIALILSEGLQRFTQIYDKYYTRAKEVVDFVNSKKED